MLTEGLQCDELPFLPRPVSLHLERQQSRELLLFLIEAEALLLAAIMTSTMGLQEWPLVKYSLCEIPLVQF